MLLTLIKYDAYDDASADVDALGSDVVQANCCTMMKVVGCAVEIEGRQMLYSAKPCGEVTNMNVALREGHHEGAERGRERD